MSGILDQKTRIMDVVLTDEGKAALAQGRFSIKYYGLTDAGCLYNTTHATSSIEKGHVFQLEASASPHDLITLVADDSGFLSSKNINSGTIIVGGKLSSTDDPSNHLTGSSFASMVDGLLETSVVSFNSNNFIMTNDTLFEESDFDLNPKTITLDYSKLDSNETVSLDILESVFEDQLLSDSLNFLYLPPINLPTDSTLDVTNPEVIADNLLGNYARLNHPQIYDNTNLQAEIESAEKEGRVKTISFNPNTRYGNSIFQIFEDSGDSIKKLDVIQWEKDPNVFFVGKVFVDSYERTTFVKLFILILEE